MDLQAVKDLAQLMEDKGLTELDVELDGQHVVLKKEVQVVASPAIPATPLAPTAPIPQVAPPVPAAEPAAGAGQEGNVVDFNNVTEVKAPMVGTVYMAPSPDEEPYVHVGDKVKKGQVLCIIEAMKLMNEFTAPQDGEIVDICVEDGQLVEYGQCLFKMF
jgi:acetyl-CoA carboxylase biotin carboxyl carrier protein